MYRCTYGAHLSDSRFTPDIPSCVAVQALYQTDLFGELLAEPEELRVKRRSCEARTNGFGP